MPWTAVGVYVPGRFFASATTTGLVAGAAGLAGAFFETVGFAGGFFEAVAFFGAFAAVFFFIFMGRTLPQPHGAGQVNANATTMETRYGNVRAINSSGMFAPPTGNATYCLPPAMYVIGAPLALAGRSTSASRRPVALS